MPHAMPQSELVRRAVVWIGAVSSDNAGRSLSSLLDEAGMRFNLSPLEQRMLLDLFTRSDDACGFAATRRPL